MMCGNYEEDLSLCLLYWNENHVPIRIRKLTGNLFRYALTKYNLRQADIDILVKITNQEGYYFRRRHQRLVYKRLIILMHRQKKHGEKFIDYRREQIALSDFEKCMNGSGNLLPTFVGLFSLDSSTNCFSYFGINPSSRRITVYTNCIQEVKRVADSRLSSIDFLDNLDFIDYVYTAQLPDIRIEES